MAIFSAGCIELTDDIKTIRKKVYASARNELDSPAMKVSVRRQNGCINYIAFLPKEKLQRENILRAASQMQGRGVVIFELDYKHVGVVCENGKVVDYILDKPEEFAEERGYATRFVDNADGPELALLNLEAYRRETWAGSVLLAFTVVLTSVIFYAGYLHLQDTQINRGNKRSLSEQYQHIVKARFDEATVKTHKIDLVAMLENVESLTRATGSYLQQVKYADERLCVEIKTPQMADLTARLPANANVTGQDAGRGIVQYCYEKI